MGEALAGGIGASLVVEGLCLPLHTTSDHLLRVGPGGNFAEANMASLYVMAAAGGNSPSLAEGLPPVRTWLVGTVDGPPTVNEEDCLPPMSPPCPRRAKIATEAVTRCLCPSLLSKLGLTMSEP